MLFFVELCTYIFPNEPREVCYFIQEKKCQMSNDMSEHEQES